MTNRTELLKEQRIRIPYSAGLDHTLTGVKASKLGRGMDSSNPEYKPLSDRKLACEIARVEGFCESGYAKSTTDDPARRRVVIKNDLAAVQSKISSNKNEDSDFKNFVDLLDIYEVPVIKAGWHDNPAMKRPTILVFAYPDEVENTIGRLKLGQYLHKLAHVYDCQEVRPESEVQGLLFCKYEGAAIPKATGGRYQMFGVDASPAMRDAENMADLLSYRWKYIPGKGIRNEFDQFDNTTGGAGICYAIRDDQLIPVLRDSDPLREDGSRDPLVKNVPYTCNFATTIDLTAKRATSVEGALRRLPDHMPPEAQRQIWTMPYRYRSEPDDGSNEQTRLDPYSGIGLILPDSYYRDEAENGREKETDFLINATATGVANLQVRRESGSDTEYFEAEG
ncbi:MAG: hypothetical protein O3C63_08245 [Cyanobacteria bacterium]|nr:hypothetical protein [Cyanobacteriota bacterium]